MSNNNNFEASMEQAGQAPVSSRASSPDDNYLNVPGQRALPTTPARGRNATKLTTPPSKRSDSEDNVSMDDIAMSTRGSSASGTTTEGGRKRAKKQPQKFCCTQFAPCDLTFTRSEHLARHIRKHTGERPFECHCGRRFSRLDNLRQHAQTVHINEDIPADSLANTGGRGPYARDRKAILSRQNARNVQPLQQGPPSGRQIGHRRNVHSMPVNQMTPMYGNYHDPGHSPAHQQMMDPRGPAFSAYGQPQPHYYSPEPFHQAPAPYNTPPSNRSSVNFGEHYQQSMGSPAHSHSQYAGDRFPPRRQSISSTVGPYFGEMPMRSLGPSMGGPVLPPLHSGVRESFHQQSANMFEQSPVSTAPSEYSQFSQYSRREDSFQMPDPRRRTWHGAGGYQRESFASITTGMNGMNLTPPEEAREAMDRNYSLELPPLRGFNDAQMSPIHRQPSPTEMEMRAAEAREYHARQQADQDRSETERSAADALASMGRQG